ncbi:uncharacterized protein LOC141674859 [Apium graveolens]|uniref:uncharacterized protein LOC141674859 n=1 Tax=Apium graveolens TaxID=4045 RepID=UPI003D7A9AB2
MITGAHQWDIDLIRDIFDDRDANLILSIPLGEDNEDNWFWRHDKLGVYSVKSTYINLQLARSRNLDNNSGFWRKLWNLKIPPKVKNFLWRSVNCCLPTKDLLRIKRVPVNMVCPFAESCRSTAALLVITGEYQSFGDWPQLIFDQSNKTSIILSVMLCWKLWGNHGQVTWQAPMHNRVKINTDATLFSDINRFSHAQVVRDHNGELVEAMSRCHQGTISPEAAEAMGIREALSWVKQKQKQDVVIETDYLVVVQWIRSSYATLSYVGREEVGYRNISAPILSASLFPKSKIALLNAHPL